MEEKILKAKYRSAKEFEASHRLKDFNFAVGSLVLVQNSRVEVELNRKMKPHYLGPMIVLRRTVGGSYLLAELDGSVSRLRFKVFRLLPYHPRSRTRIPVTTVTGLEDEELDRLADGEDEEKQPDEVEVDNHPS